MRAQRIVTMVAMPAAALLAGGCERRGALDPAGPEATLIAGMWWVMLAVATAVTMLVLALLVAVAWRARRDRDGADPGPLRGDDPATRRRLVRMVAAFGVVLPLLAALTLVSGSVYVDHAIGSLSPPEAAARDRDGSDLTVWVVGNRWWWDILYEDEDGELVARSANEVAIPVGRRVQLLLTSNGIIHSLWVPRLGGKTDVNPRRVSTAWLQADEPGEHLGMCAEFCGRQHAHMALRVLAMQAEEFEGWLDQQARPAVEPRSAAASRGMEVFVGAGSCGSCHQVSGIPGAEGLLGPDLTHVASRRTLAGGALENSARARERFVRDPQAVKPGALMPRIELAEDDTQDLLAFLKELE